MDPDPLSCILNLIPSVSSDIITFTAPGVGAIVAMAIAVAGLLFSAFNSGSEIAYFSLSRTDIDHMPDDAAKQRVERLLESPEKLLATILIGNNIVNIMIVILLNYAMNDMFKFNSAVASFITQTVILTFLILLFGEVLPKLYATGNNTRFARFTSAPMEVLERVFSPLSRLLVKGTSVVRNRVADKGDDITPEDLSTALAKSDVSNEEEKELLTGILEFGKKTVSDIMVPRLDMVNVDMSQDFDEVVATVVEHGYSRMPVTDGSEDKIKGVLYAKDLLPYIGNQSNTFKWQKLLRSVYYVPESRPISDLLEDFRKKKTHIAIVVDEFGCTQGLATLEDVLEEIVGDIDDEYDTEGEKYYTQADDNTYIFNGRTPVEVFLDVMGYRESDFDEVIDDEVDTVAGLLLSAKGDFPKEKEELDIGPCRFTVLKIKKFRVTKVKVTRKAE